MDKRLGINEMADSQSAMKNYIAFREENRYRHKARVLISSNGKNRFNDILYISVVIESGNSYVIVEGTNEFANDFRGTYSFTNWKFKLIGGTLIIQAKDRWKNPISVEITGV